MAFKHVVLGFLVDQPMHGYQLKRAVSPALPADQMINDGVLYPLLKRMEREGLVTSRLERARKAPDRRVFRPTKLGRQAFTEWLESAGDEQDEIAYDFLSGHPFLAKSLFFDQLSARQVREKLEAQLESSTAKLRTFEEIRKGMADRDVSAYRIAVLDLGIAQQRERVAWLRKMVANPVGRRKSARQTRKVRKAA
jgi:DNA-binding PadR family transcriptional regulator